MPIRKKLILFYGGLLAAVVIILGIIVLSMVRWAMIDTIDNTLEDTANYIITNSNVFAVPSGLEGQWVSAVALPPLDTFRAPGIYVQIWRTAGQDLEYSAASSNLGKFRLPLDESGLGKTEPQYTDVVINDTSWRVLTRPILIDRQLWGNVQVTTSLEAVHQTTGRLIGVVVGITVLALFGVVALTITFSHRALKPIEDITCAAASIVNADDLNTRLPWQGPDDELGRLVSVFNRMMGRLERAFNVQQRFVADVSHELRTPLTAIRGNLEIIKRYGMDADSLEAIDSETERMARMVDDLLLLVRADSGSVKLDRYPLDLDTVVSEVYQQARILIHSRDLTLKMDFFEPVRINGNSDRIKQLLFNLISNAIKFTPDGGEIALGLRQEKGEAVIQVRDTGIGIPPHALNHIFDRFYQVDEARTHVDDSVSAGLGLAIAQWVAEAHGGTLEVNSKLGSGSVFTARFPLLEPPVRAPEPVDNSKITRPRLPRLVVRS